MTTESEFLGTMANRMHELLEDNPGEPEDWPDAAKLRLVALMLDYEDYEEGKYDHTEIQGDLRRIANYIEELDKLMLTPQDLMEVRDAADILSDVDDEVAYDLGKVGDKIADLLKLVVDTS